MYNPVFKANLPLPKHIERTIPLYCLIRNYVEIDNVFATIDYTFGGYNFWIFYTPKLTEIQRRISLLQHRIEAYHSA